MDNQEGRFVIPQSVNPPEQPPQDFADEQQGQQEQEQPEEKREGWGWVGAPDHPEAQKHDDGISDLFDVGQEDDTSDLVSVDIEKDIIDANERGGLDDLTEVSTEDIMGDEETGQIPLEYSPDDDERIRQFNGQQQKPRYRIAPRGSTRPDRTPPETSMRGMQ